MTYKEKLERLKSLESMADDCLIEIATLTKNTSILNRWYTIRDDIQFAISSLEADIEYYEFCRDNP